MVHKNKNTTNIESINRTISHIGCTAMVAAATITTLHIYERAWHKAQEAMHAQPAYAYAIADPNAHRIHGEGEEHLRRSHEEIRHDSPSYGLAKRSHPVSGSL